MSIWVIIETFKSDDVIRNLENAILAFCDVIRLMRSLWRQNNINNNPTITSHYNPTN